MTKKSEHFVVDITMKRWPPLKVFPSPPTTAPLSPALMKWPMVTTTLWWAHRHHHPVMHYCAMYIVYMLCMHCVIPWLTISLVVRHVSLHVKCRYTLHCNCVHRMTFVTRSHKPRNKLQTQVSHFKMHSSWNQNDQFQDVVICKFEWFSYLLVLQQHILDTFKKIVPGDYHWQLSAYTIASS